MHKLSMVSPRKMTAVTKWLIIFFAMTALDFVYARYTLAVARKAKLVASNYSILIILITGFSVIEYTKDPMLLIPAAAGAWVGTYLGMRLHEKRKACI
jgi:hypothetical protein